MSAFPMQWPTAHGGPFIQGVIRQQPEDFHVTEIPRYEPEGEGDFLWLKIRKRNQNTDWIAQQLIKIAGIKNNDVQYAGKKDRNAVTEQWFSIHLHGQAEPDLQALLSDDVQILESVRDRSGLRRGNLKGNDFTICVRKLEGDIPALETVLETIQQQGIPNYFGEQRFGHDGNNLLCAQQLFTDSSFRPAKNLRGIYLSAARSYLFNKVLSYRVYHGHWNQAMDGEWLQSPASKSRFIIGRMDDATRARIDKMEINPTGPLWGKGQPESKRECLQMEQRLLNSLETFRTGLEKAGLQQDRRSLRLRVENLSWDIEGDVLQMTFFLPAGCYATSLLREIVCY
ncbi:MAG: tRNA pseudouridine(13) synthase TruD [Gammaproteobacteria bacterium]|nr:tRNA pseudouridine(13) synthase TruD [Gammaproteobacteria bacterium]